MNLKIQKLSSKRPGTTKKLAVENTKIWAMVVEITGEVQRLNKEEKTLTRILFDSYVVEAARIELLLKSFSPYPPSN